MHKFKSHYEVKKMPSMKVFPGKGVIIDGGYLRRRWVPDFEENKRGKIKGWSTASRRRMREHMITKKFPDGWQEFGITLTVPGTDLENICRNWQELKQRFFEFLKNCGFSGVWRLEMQGRGMPHLHCHFGRDMSAPLRFQRKDYSVICSGCNEEIPKGRSGTDTKVSRRLRWPSSCQIYDFFHDTWLYYLSKCSPLPPVYVPKLKIPKTKETKKGVKLPDGTTLMSAYDIEKVANETLNASLGESFHGHCFWLDEKGNTAAVFRPKFEAYYSKSDETILERVKWVTVFDDRINSAFNPGAVFEHIGKRHFKVKGLDVEMKYAKYAKWGYFEYFKPSEKVCFDLPPGVLLRDSRHVMAGAWASAVDIDCRGCDYSWLRYLQDHASKRKQGQLPGDVEIGRHWGVINRSKRIPADHQTWVDLPDRVHQRVTKWVSRIRTRKIRKDGVPFGKRLGHRPSAGRLGYGQQVSFVNTKTFERLLLFAIDMEEES